MATPFPKPQPSTVHQHLSGATQSWHGKITPDGPFTPERERYRLYIGLFCPFAHRVNLIRHLKGLQDIIPVTVVKPYPKGDERGWPGWKFPASEGEYPGATPDPLFGSGYLHELYFRADPNYKGRYSVPVLWDTKTDTIVNNESAELLRDFSTCFDSLIEDPAKKDLTLYPDELKEEIDRYTEWMQNELNIGVYKAGFAHTQEEYEKACLRVFAALNVLEQLLANHRGRGPYILGQKLTELDIRAYATIVRFDTVYVQHFKCNLGMIRHDYPQIKRWVGNLYWNVTGFRGTTDFRHIKENYTKSHYDINPRGITALGPWPDVEPLVPGDDEARVGGVDMAEVRRLSGRC
ncbi:glutathione S-transferase [Podospora australis]|uniref:Glutathione S-transferase n=1 Tax=Podospora australis TaxID=1536484 RepID=A0AAN6WMC4_9PEZI|nr:glutathione S-transferase [Podospora australis]